MTAMRTMTMTTSSTVTEGDIPLTMEPGGQGARGLGQELEKLLVSPFILAVLGAGGAEQQIDRNRIQGK